MPEHRLVVTARSGREVPARVAGLLLPLDVEMVAMHFTHPPHSQDWRIELTVRVPSGGRLDFLVKRLDRLVDVTQVSATDSGGEDEEPAPCADTVTGDPGTYAYAN
jgi:acetolactate synthase-1/3 small subunit